MKKCFSIISGFLLLFCLEGCGKKEGPGGAQGFRPLPKVEVQEVQPVDISYEIEAVGTLEADEVFVHSQVEGVVTRVNFQEGDLVKKGETVLVEVDPEKFELNRMKTQANKDRTLAVYRKKKEDLQKREELFKKGVVTEDEYRNYRTEMKEAKANFHEAKAQWLMSQKEERESRVQSPVTGIVQSKGVALGAYVKPDSKIATLLDSSNIRVQFSVSVEEAQKLSLGQEMSFPIQNRLQSRYEGQIFFIRQYADPQTRRVLCKADRIRSLESGELRDLKPGSYVQVDIETQLQKDAIVIPQSACLSTEDGFKVFVAEGMAARQRRVQIGLHTKEGQVEILEGLNAGDRLITRGAQVLRDGIEIDVIPLQKKES